jgi:hypothetical protein
MWIITEKYEDSKTYAANSRECNEKHRDNHIEFWCTYTHRQFTIVKVDWLGWLHLISLTWS